MVNTKVQLQQGARKVQQGAAAAAAGVGTKAQSAAQAAAQAAAQRAQQAASGMNEGLRAGSLSARHWVAPRLEDVADFTTSTVAPAVSDVVVKTVAPQVAAALRNAADQVSPTPRRRSKFRSVVTWTAFTAAVLAGAGAAGAIVWRRYRAAMAADTEPDTAQGTESAAQGGKKAPADEDTASKNGSAPSSKAKSAK